MGQKFKLDDKEYEVENLSDQASATLNALKFVTERLQELHNMHALLQRAKQSYVKSIKQEMLSSKAGFPLEED